MKYWLKIAAAGAITVVGLASGVALANGGYPGHTTSTGGGHTPVTICHKPGTPAEQTLVVDDDSVELTGHLGHGDTLGPCPGTTTTTPTETTPTDTTPTTPTETQPTTPTETTPTTPSEQCPPGMVPTAGKDGEPGNDECEFPETTTTTPSTPPMVTVTETPPATTATTPAPSTEPPAPVTPQAKPKPKPDNPPVKAVKKKVNLTGNPKTDKCKDLGNGTARCKGIVVTMGSG